MTKHEPAKASFVCSECGVAWLELAVLLRHIAAMHNHATPLYRFSDLLE
jgi:hypothetical protein